MPKFWLISSRDNGATGGGRNPNGPTYWTSDGVQGNPTWQTDIANWQTSTPDAFQQALKDAAKNFPPVGSVPVEQQYHVTLLIHGFNVDFAHATTFYTNLYPQLFNGTGQTAPNPIPFPVNGICVLYDWPSLGSVAGYLPDRATARACAEDLANVLDDLYDWLLIMQKVAAANPTDPTKACRAKVSVVAHSMGNYVLQNAMSTLWTRINQPLLVSMFDQVIMVAADVDNDLFDYGASDFGDGTAMINLIYRISALYSGRDAVLGASAGLKHFGTRRLGRAGLANEPPLSNTPPATDNVWDNDCSSFFSPSVGGIDIHSAYFNTPGTIQLMRQILCGIDREVLKTLGYTAGNAWLGA